jgi:hypothetical protein
MFFMATSLRLKDHSLLKGQVLTKHLNGASTLSITTFKLTTFSRTIKNATLSMNSQALTKYLNGATTLSIMTLGITTFSITKK